VVEFEAIEREREKAVMRKFLKIRGLKNFVENQPRNMIT
jgi:hypothetical protein